MDNDQQGRIDWRDGVPISARFDDPYFSLDDGLAEKRHVFLDGNDLPARFGGDFHVAELGFGTGLNFLVTWEAWERAGRPGTLRYTSFEAFLMPPDDMAQALTAFPALAARVAAMLYAVRCGPAPYELGGIVLELVIGDARVTLPTWGGIADTWYLDGFSPIKNPEMWQIDLLRSVAAQTQRGGTLSSYTAAGQVRRDLAAVGFDVTRAPGYGRKRHMTRAVRPA